MNVKDVMSRELRTVRAVDRLDTAARVMWEQDCGLVPVVDGSNMLVGVVTDRDLCMASYTQGRALGEIPVAAAMARSLRTCRPDDTLAMAITAMQDAQVHRLPVVDARGVAIGILTVNDLVRLAATRPSVLEAGPMIKVVAAITAPRRAAAKVTPVAPVATAPAKAAPITAAAPALTAVATAAISAPAKVPAKAATKGGKDARDAKARPKPKKS